MARNGAPKSDDYYALKQEEMEALVREANRMTAAGEVRVLRARARAMVAYELNRQQLIALGQLLPKRAPGEPLLKWLPRCQAAAIDAALLVASYNDPALDITKTDTGWEVLHKNNGQRIAITSTQEVADSA